MAKRIHHADHTTVTAPAQGRMLPIDPSAGTLEKLDVRHLADIRNALAPRGGINLGGEDATGANLPSVVWAALTGQLIGTDPFSVVMVLQVPSAAPTYQQSLMNLSSVSTQGSLEGVKAYIGNASIDLTVEIYGAGGFGDINRATFAGFITNYAGKTIVLAMVRPAAGNLAIYINGVGVTPTHTTAGTPPTWQGNVVSNYLLIGNGGTEQFDQPILSASIYNLELSAVDAREIYELGGAVPDRYRWGGQKRNTSACINNTGGNPYSTFSGASAAGFAAATAATGYAQTAPNFTVKKGQAVKVSFTLTLNSGIAPRVNLAFPNAYDASAQTRATAGANAITLTTTRNASPAAVVFSNQAEAGDYVVASLVVNHLGAIAHFPLDDGCFAYLRDESINRLFGVHQNLGRGRDIHIVPRFAPVQLFATTSTNGNQQLFGSGMWGGGITQFLRIRARARSGAPSITIGDTSGGSQFVASVALSTTWKDLTLVATIPTSNGNMWIGSNSTDVVEVSVSLEPLSQT